MAHSVTTELGRQYHKDILFDIPRVLIQALYRSLNAATLMTLVSESLFPSPETATFFQRKYLQHTHLPALNQETTVQEMMGEFMRFLEKHPELIGDPRTIVDFYQRFSFLFPDSDPTLVQEAAARMHWIHPGQKLETISGFSRLFEFGLATGKITPEEAGTYLFAFSAGCIPDGISFYHLRSGESWTEEQIAAFWQEKVPDTISYNVVRIISLLSPLGVRTPLLGTLASSTGALQSWEDTSDFQESQTATQETTTPAVEVPPTLNIHIAPSPTVQQEDTGLIYAPMDEDTREFMEALNRQKMAAEYVDDSLTIGIVSTELAALQLTPEMVVMNPKFAEAGAQWVVNSDNVITGLIAKAATISEILVTLGLTVVIIGGGMAGAAQHTIENDPVVTARYAVLHGQGWQKVLPLDITEDGRIILRVNDAEVNVAQATDTSKMTMKERQERMETDTFYRHDKEGPKKPKRVPEDYCGISVEKLYALKFANEIVANYGKEIMIGAIMPDEQYKAFVKIYKDYTGEGGTGVNVSNNTNNSLSSQLEELHKTLNKEDADGRNCGNVLHVQYKLNRDGVLINRSGRVDAGAAQVKADARTFKTVEELMEYSYKFAREMLDWAASAY